MATRSTKYYLALAKKHGLTIKAGSKHWKIEGVDPASGKRSVMMVPHELKGVGTEHAIRRWLIRMGALLAFAFFAMLLLHW